MQQMEVSDYVNERPRPKQKGSGDANQTERRLCQVLLLSFGLLCVIQAILNVSLRLTLYSTHLDCNATNFSYQDKVKKVQKDCEGEPPGQCNGLKERFNALTRDKNDLENRNSELNNMIKDLEEERDRLRTNPEKDVEARFKNLTEERDDLKRKLNNLGQGGWEYFSGKFYYSSSMEKTWQESRDDCLQKGADLMIINSKEEQDFTRKYQKRLWIGLTDSETEGMWKWVDGTPLTKSYWDSGEPNGEESENCGQIFNYNLENSWNDESCSSSVYWICVMKVRP
ncbi:CD209 antigen-like protein A isoform X2 [Perca fluviatilis]|uniref:CD209 antigen-like protein A isoform X2 n=1 Tax=Perca fluviatilis TaxID=8168 RepID=UPI00196338CE|nr:CD209 antigen-like protein A isoform X2 [Perca fluviatilis]